MTVPPALPGGPDGPRHLSPWSVLRSTIHVMVSVEAGTDRQTLVHGAAHAARTPEVTPQQVRPMTGYELVALLPGGCGLWIDAGTAGWTTLTASVVDGLRPYAVPVPDGVHLVWEDFPPISALDALVAEVRRAARIHDDVDAVWLLGMQVGDAAREGLLVVGSRDAGPAMEAVALAARSALPDPSQREAEIRLVAFPDLPPRVQELLATRRPAYSRVGGPTPTPHARRTVDHLQVLVVQEEARGNSVASGDTALVDGKPAVVMRYPLDVDAISLENALQDGHRLVDLGDRWAVVCDHGSPSQKIAVLPFQVGQTRTRGVVSESDEVVLDTATRP